MNVMVAGTSAHGVKFVFNHYRLQKALRDRLDRNQFKEMRLAARTAADQMALLVANKTKEYLRNLGPNRVGGRRGYNTGRLIAGIGIYTADDVTYENTDPYYPNASRPSDAFMMPYTRGGVYFTEVGTNVPYANAVNYGFTWPGADGGSRSFLKNTPDNERFITQQEFSFGGYHFMEAGVAAAQLDKIQLRRIEHNAFRRFKYRWDKRM